MNKPALLMYYDNPYADVGDVGSVSARKLADSIGYDFVLRRSAKFQDPWMEKENIILDELPDRPRVVYLDCDSVCMPASKEEVEGLFTQPINFPQDAYGPCTGLIAVNNHPTALKFFRIWKGLGQPDIDPTLVHDQATFKILWTNYRWIRDASSLVPVSLVSNPTSLPTLGRIVHLEWTRVFDHNKIAAHMLDLTKKAWGDTP